MIDFLIMSLIGQFGLNLLIIAAAKLLEGLSPGSEAWAAALAGLLFFALYNGYFIVFEWLWNGQTPGKRMLQIRVIRQGGYALRFFDTILRNLLRVIDFLPLFYGVGLISLLITKRSQRVGDLVAGTLVVYQEPVETDSLLIEFQSVSTSEPLPTAAVAAVSRELLGIVGIFLRSKEDMVPRPRQELAAELAELIREASGLAPKVGQSVENFLITVLRESEHSHPSSSPPLGEAGILF